MNSESESLRALNELFENDFIQESEYRIRLQDLKQNEEKNPKKKEEFIEKKSTPSREANKVTVTTQKLTTTKSTPTKSTTLTESQTETTTKSTTKSTTLTESQTETISKTLAYLLRHIPSGLKFTSEGYVELFKIVDWRTFRGFCVEEILFVVENSRSYGKPRFILKADSKGKYWIKAASFGSQKGIKNWMGFPIANIKKFQEASNFLQPGRSIKKFHVSLGWCKTLPELLYSPSCLNLTEKLKTICREMRNQIFLRFSGFEIIGKRKDKIVCVFDPYLKISGNVDKRFFLGFHRRILDLWRKAAEEYATKKKMKFRKYPDESGHLEFGEADGAKIYQMKIIDPKFHITIGKGTLVDLERLKGWKFPVIQIEASKVYIDQGSFTPIV